MQSLYKAIPDTQKDLDVCVEMSEENADKVLMVMEEFGFKSLQLKKEDFLNKNPVTQLGHEPVGMI